MKNTILSILLALLGMTQMVAQNDDYLPIVREGVKWVNEKVIINNGDTTHYYYTYEFCGKDSDELYTNLEGDINNACYYYTSDNLDVEKDSLIAGLRDVNTNVTCFRNNAYLKVLSEKRSLFRLLYASDGGTWTLYQFFSPGDCLNYYFNVQYYELYPNGGEPILTTDNFIVIDPIEIEGVECIRCAYYDEQGNPLAYIVEGIGFDSYDMGDLLTPFTRRPDPTADYQEYCGLSHVVKDGKIIYKGMRYREGVQTGINEVVADQPRGVVDDNYYNLMGQAVGKDIPTTPGIYIHQGRKIVVR